MASLEIGLIGVIALFAAILLGVNVMVALGAVGALGLTAVVGFHAATSMLSTVFFETTHSFHFSVIPLFLLMGYFAMRAGLGEDLFDASHKWFGGLPGGLAISTTLGAAAFGAASGSSIGTATVFTKLALPQMLDRGYDKRHGLGLDRHRRHAGGDDPAERGDGDLRHPHRLLDRRAADRRRHSRPRVRRCCCAAPPC